MSDYNRRAEKRISELAAKVATQFDSTIMHNRVHETVDNRHNGPNDLIRTLDLAESAYDLSDVTDIDDLDDAAFGAAEQLNDVVDDLVAVQIATACADVILDGDAWVDTWDRSKVGAAQIEAKGWLGNNLDAAERAGVLTPVRKHVLKSEVTEDDA